MLKKQGHSVLGDWKQRYVALKGDGFCYYRSQEVKLSVCLVAYYISECFLGLEKWASNS